MGLYVTLRKFSVEISNEILQWNFHREKLRENLHQHVWNVTRHDEVTPTAHFKLGSSSTLAGSLARCMNSHVTRWWNTKLKQEVASSRLWRRAPYNAFHRGEGVSS